MALKYRWICKISIFSESSPLMFQLYVPIERWMLKGTICLFLQ